MFHDILKKMYTTYYQWGLYSDRDIAGFVGMQLITPQDYRDITGQDYPEAPARE